MEPAVPPAPAPEAVLIMVDRGRYRRLGGVAPGAVLDMDVTALLEELRRDRNYAEELKGEVPNRCTVTVAASASEAKPTNAEVEASRELEGAITLGRLAAGTPAAAGGGPYYLYVRVHLPTRAGARAGGGGEAAHREYAVTVRAPTPPHPPSSSSSSSSFHDAAAQRARTLTRHTHALACTRASPPRVPTPRRDACRRRGHASR